jgi:uncharacterized membrane protein YphA (DoxX/SURF4 family)
VDVEKASAREASDLANIKRAIEASGGFLKTNQLVIGAMQGWMIGEARAALGAMPTAEARGTSALIGALAILCGFGTRISAIALIVVTMVATAAVHWPADWSTLSELAQGYAITNKGFGNFKLPAIYLVALLPLLFAGAGKLSVDAWLARVFWQRHTR